MTGTHTGYLMKVGQRKYTEEVINLAQLTNIEAVNTPLELNVKFSKEIRDGLPGNVIYQRLLGA